MKGSKIIVSVPPKGTFDECFVSGTPKPGTVMEMTSTAPVGGVFEWAAYGTAAASAGQGVSADGDRKVIAILTEDTNQGKVFSDAYAAADKGFLYFPAMGERFNMIIENQSGTADSFAIGDELMVDDGTGKLLAVGADVEAHPFTVLETVAALTADAHVHVRFNGSAG